MQTLFAAQTQTIIGEIDALAAEEVQANCNSSDTYLQSQWQILDSGTGYLTDGSTVQFEIRNPNYNLCMTASATSGANSVKMVVSSCTLGGTAADTFQLG